MKILEEVTREQVFGLIILLAGIGIVWYVQKKRYNRRGFDGMQVTRGFESGCLIGIFESALMLVGVAAIGLGGFMLAVDWLF